MKKLTLRAYGNIGLAALLVGASYWAVSSFGDSPTASAATRTSTAKQSTVMSTVSASGNLASTTDLTLGFPISGTLTEVDVKAGDSVTAGQVLAKIDPASAQAALDSANANLTAAKEKLANLQASSTSTTATTSKAGNSNQAVESAQRAADANARQYQAAVDKAQKDLDDANTALVTAQGNLVSAQSSGDSSAIATAQTAVFSAQNAVSSKQQAVNSAQLAQSTGTIRDNQTVTAAQSSANSNTSSSSNASNQSSSTASSGDIATAAAAVTTAEAAVETARDNLDATTLVAPAAGTIATVSKAVGDTISGSSSSSSSTNGSSTQSSTGGASTTSSSSSSSSSGFITLIDLNTYQIKAGFSESDAAKVKAGEAATVSVTAASSETFNAHVTSMDVTATTVSNVVTYYATVTLDSAASDLRPGMTATVSVVSESKDNVINVPTAAVQTSGTNSGTVTLVKDGQQTRTQVTTGLKGDDSIEIVSGLSVGDEVVISTGTTTNSSSSSSSRSSSSGTLTGSTSGGGGNFGGGQGGPPGGS